MEYVSNKLHKITLSRSLTLFTFITSFILFTSLLCLTSCKKNNSTEYTLKSPNGDVVSMQLSMPSKWECNVDSDNKIFTITNETGIEVFRGMIETKETYETYMEEVKELNTIMTFEAISETDTSFFCNLKDEEWDYFQLVPDSNSGLIGGSTTSQKDVETLIADLKLECTQKGNVSAESSASSAGSSAGSPASSASSTGSSISSASFSSSSSSGSQAGNSNIPHIPETATFPNKLVASSSNENITFELAGDVKLTDDVYRIPIYITNNTDYDIEVWEYEIAINGIACDSSFVYKLKAKQSGNFEASFAVLTLREHGISEITEISAGESRDCFIMKDGESISNFEGTIIPRFSITFAEPIKTGCNPGEIVYDRNGIRIRRTVLSIVDWGQYDHSMGAHALIDNRNSYNIELIPTNIRASGECAPWENITVDAGYIGYLYPLVDTNGIVNDITLDITIVNAETGEEVDTAKDIRLFYPDEDIAYWEF